VRKTFWWTYGGSALGALMMLLGAFILAPNPTLEILNAPSRESFCVRRERTDTPLQALVTMNDPQFVEAARNLAQHAMVAGAGDAEKTLNYIARHILCRPLKEQEKPIVLTSHQDLLDFYQGHADDAKALIAVSCSSTYTSGIGTPEAIAISDTTFNSRLRWMSRVSGSTSTPPRLRATTPPPPRSSTDLYRLASPSTPITINVEKIAAPGLRAAYPSGSISSP